VHMLMKISVDEHVTCIIIIIIIISVYTQ